MSSETPETWLEREFREMEERARWRSMPQSDVAEEVFPGDWHRYQRAISWRDEQAMDPLCLNPDYPGGWAWWADRILQAVEDAPNEDRHRVAARELQAIYRALRL